MALRLDPGSRLRLVNILVVVDAVPFALAWKVATGTCKHSTTLASENFL